MPEFIKKLRGFWFETLWRLEAADLSRTRRWSVQAMRTLWVLIRDIGEGQITLRAMSLVYTTLLSLVPLLAVSFSVLKGFGVHNQIEPLLRNLLLPLGPRGAEIATRVIEFVDNIRVGVLGVFGLALLLYTVVSMVQKIEAAFNEIWHVTNTRPLARRFSDYLSVILVGPVLMFTAVGVTASLSNSAVVQYFIAIQPLGVLLEILGTLIPYVLVIAAFAFIYIFVPNTRVALKPAAIGAFVAGILWATLGWGFATFVASSAKYTAVYSAFATLLLFMIWLYLGWLILLIGAKVAFYIQHPEFVSRERGAIRLSNRQREGLGLAVMLGIARAFEQGEPAPDARKLVSELRVPPDAVNQVLEPLSDAGLIRAVVDSAYGWQPARSLSKISIAEVMDTLRHCREDARVAGIVKVEPTVEELLQRLDQARKEAMHDRSLLDLL